MGHHNSSKSSTNRFLFFLFLSVCALSVAADFFVHKHHVHFSLEEGVGFYAVYGFVSFVLLVAVSKFILRPLVSRPEDYYD